MLNGNAEVESPGMNAPRAKVLMYFLRFIYLFYSTDIAL